MNEKELGLALDAISAETEDYIFSRLRKKDIIDLNVCVLFNGDNLSIDVYLVCENRENEEELARLAVEAGFSKADELF